MDGDQKIMTFLMFAGQAEEAMNFYISVFTNSEIINITRYGPNEMGKEGTVLHATFSLMGQLFMCNDSNVEQNFGFTPAISLYIRFDSEDELDTIFNRLSQDGLILMPLAAYFFSTKFGWVQDKYGVSWQLDYKLDQ